MKITDQVAVGGHAFLGGAEHQVSIVGNEASANYPENKCIHHLFEEQAKERPKNIAVVSDDGQLTYEELDKKSNQFAHYLQSRGVVPETLVGICLDRSLHMIISILSVLKAGGAYVPIDPEYPEDRIAFMLEDSRCPILITQKRFRAVLPESGTELVVYDEVLPEIADESIARVDSSATPDNLAYIIYTSGSTGKPKGVMIENRNVVRLLFNDRFQFDFTELDVWSIFHSFCFDFSVWEMYGALLFGGKAVIVPKRSAQDPHEFADIILKEKITVVNQTPSAFYNLIPRLLELSEKPTFIRYVIFGGEKLNPAKLGAVKKRYPNTRFVNMYGITETTVHVTYKEITEEDIAQGFSNIGQPIPTLKVFIFDEHMQLVPVGEVGELCVGGVGVARGYLNRNKLTNERFISNPFNPGEKIYRSGDLACIRGNGDIEYFGRIDNQVQLRGFRIELGEIESVLSTLEEIKDCVVVVNEDLNEDKRIIAYLITDRKEISAAALKNKIAQHLPDYMIPSFFIKLDKFPLTVNGKLDNEQLPLPNLDNISTADYSPPKDDMERSLAEIWGEILGIDQSKIGRGYNFFEIGGHSLSVVMLSQCVREKFKKAITNRHIYENPNISDLSKVILELEEIDNRPAVENVDEPPRDGVHPIISAQLICWLVKFLLKVKTSNVCEVYCLNGTFDIVSFRKSLKNIARRHDSLWYPFSFEKPVVRITRPGQCDVELIDISDNDEEKEEQRLNARIAAIIHQPFDLSQTPLLRMTVIKTEAQKHLLLVSSPHIVSDIASINTFVRDIFDDYRPAGEREEQGGQLRMTSSKELVAEEIEYFKSDDYPKDRDFWKAKIGDADLLKFNRDFFLEVGETGAGRLLTKIKLDEAVIEKLQEISDQAATSIQVVILALIHATLHTFSGQSDILTAMVSDIRGQNAYPPVVQMNSTVIGVRSEFSNHTDYAELISHIKWFLVDALNHVKLPSSILMTFPFFSMLKRRPIAAIIAQLVTYAGRWRYRKSGVNKDILKAQVTYMLGMLLLASKVRKKHKPLRLSLPIAFNVLPDFFENRVLWSNADLSVAGLRDRELTMDPHVFEAGSRYQDARILNIDLLRDKNDEACIYLWGGKFNQKGFDRIEELFLKHLEILLEDPKKNIYREENI